MSFLLGEWNCTEEKNCIVVALELLEPGLEDELLEDDLHS
jgi:hypothetical protein